MNNKNVKYDENNKLKRKSRVTVCIAAINGGVILGVSDRMITAGDIEFQQPQPKIWQITNSIAIMTAGDLNIQTQVYIKVLEIVTAKINSNPKEWVKVADVADIYSDCFLKLKAKLAEKEVLSIHILDHKSFIKQLKEMTPEFIEDIMYRIRRFSMEEIETIIAGIDSLGPHIYVVKSGKISCADRIGFDSIGIGSNHALSHFMLSAYSSSVPASKAVLTIHQAKRKSEVSPGVGKETDMFLIGPYLGTFRMIEEAFPDRKIVKDLDDFYDTYRNQIHDLDEVTEKNIADYWDKLIKPPESKQESGSIPSPSQPPEESK